MRQIMACIHDSPREQGPPTCLRTSPENGEFLHHHWTYTTPFFLNPVAGPLVQALPRCPWWRTRLRQEGTSKPRLGRESRRSTPSLWRAWTGRTMSTTFRLCTRSAAGYEKRMEWCAISAAARYMHIASEQSRFLAARAAPPHTLTLSRPQESDALFARLPPHA